MAAILVVGLGCEQVLAGPFIPDDGAVVLERLPGDLGSTVAALRRLQGGTSAARSRCGAGGVTRILQPKASAARTRA